MPLGKALARRIYRWYLSGGVVTDTATKAPSFSRHYHSRETLAPLLQDHLDRHLPAVLQQLVLDYAALSDVERLFTSSRVQARVQMEPESFGRLLWPDQMLDMYVNGAETRVMVLSRWDQPGIYTIVSYELQQHSKLGSSRTKTFRCEAEVTEILGPTPGDDDWLYLKTRDNRVVLWDIDIRGGAVLTPMTERPPPGLLPVVPAWGSGVVWVPSPPITTSVKARRHDDGSFRANLPPLPEYEVQEQETKTGEREVCVRVGAASVSLSMPLLQTTFRDLRAAWISPRSAAAGHGFMLLLFNQPSPGGSLISVSWL